MRLVWRETALDDRKSIMDYIARDNPQAALSLDDELVAVAERIADGGLIHKPGLVADTHEAIIHRHYRMIYEHDGQTVTILNIIHTSRDWPA